ncbi:HD domain-containing protein [Buttiauxella agrestis]
MVSRFIATDEDESLPEFFADKAWREKLKQQSWLIAGLTVLADWLGSNHIYFPLVSEIYPLAEYWQKAQNQAQRALQQLSLPSAIQPFNSYQTLFPFIEHLTPLQQKALQVDISAPGPQLMVLEDVTGAGKRRLHSYWRIVYCPLARATACMSGFLPWRLQMPCITAFLRPGVDCLRNIACLL